MCLQCSRFDPSDNLGKARMLKKCGALHAAVCDGFTRSGNPGFVG
jgi:hypothetical protein